MTPETRARFIRNYLTNAQILKSLEEAHKAAQTEVNRKWFELLRAEIHWRNQNGLTFTAEQKEALTVDFHAQLIDAYRTNTPPPKEVYWWELPKIPPKFDLTIDVIDTIFYVYDGQTLLGQIDLGQKPNKITLTRDGNFIAASTPK